jgi:hypothetical protein
MAGIVIVSNYLILDTLLEFVRELLGGDLAAPQAEKYRSPSKPTSVKRGRLSFSHAVQGGFKPRCTESVALCCTHGATMHPAIRQALTDRAGIVPSSRRREQRPVNLLHQSPSFRRGPFLNALVGPLADLVRAMNCYYSNLIEGHNTYPVDIERAMNNDYSADPEAGSMAAA